MVYLGTISSIGVAAQLSQGAGAGAWGRVVGSSTCFLLFIMGLIKGTRNITRADWITLAVALLAIPLWIITHTPVWSVLLVCTIDTLGYIPTVRKSWEKPYEETARSYAFSSCSALFSVLAVENYTLSTWLYPSVLMTTNACMALFLMLRRRRGYTLAGLPSRSPFYSPSSPPSTYKKLWRRLVAGAVHD